MLSMIPTEVLRVDCKVLVGIVFVGDPEVKDAEEGEVQSTVYDIRVAFA